MGYLTKFCCPPILMVTFDPEDSKDTVHKKIGEKLQIHGFTKFSKEDYKFQRMSRTLILGDIAQDGFTGMELKALYRQQSAIITIKMQYSVDPPSEVRLLLLVLSFTCLFHRLPLPLLLLGDNNNNNNWILEPLLGFKNISLFPYKVIGKAPTTNVQFFSNLLLCDAQLSQV